MFTAHPCDAATSTDHQSELTMCRYFKMCQTHRHDSQQSRAIRAAYLRSTVVSTARGHWGSMENIDYVGVVQYKVLHSRQQFM